MPSVHDTQFKKKKTRQCKYDEGVYEKDRESVVDTELTVSQRELKQSNGVSTMKEHIA